MNYCLTCNHCIHIWETFPSGQCVFFVGYGKGTRMVQVNKDTCPNHTVTVQEERELEQTQNRRR